jgi:Zn-dependent protease/predicted transcriptional regulator
MNGTRGLRLGRVFGIQITIDSSWIFIALLMTWSLAVAFARWHPTWSGGTAIATAILATLLFFATVLLHELSHSVVARRFGVPVRSITLFLFGGVSNIEREPPSAKAEFFTAVVGPLTSIGLGVVLLAIGSAVMSLRSDAAVDPTATLALLGPGETLLMWLGSINVLVGAFNLIPGFPLDGGRLLRSIIWGATKNLHVATRWASAIGQAIGWGFVLLGVAMAFGARVPFFGQGLVGGLWLAFIGWFLSAAAAATWRRQLMHELVEGLPVSSLMRPPAAIVPPNWSVEEFVSERLMRTEDRAFAVVDDEGKLLGLATFADARRTPRPLWNETRVADVMTPRDRLLTTSPREDLAEALEKLTRAGVDQLPVIDGERLVGMLCRGDISRWLELHARPQAQRYAQ